MTSPNVKNRRAEAIAIFSLASFATHKVFPYLARHTEIGGGSQSEVVGWLLNDASVIVMFFFVALALAMNWSAVPKLSRVGLAASASVLAIGVSGLIFPFEGAWIDEVFGSASMDSIFSTSTVVRTFMLLGALLSPRVTLAMQRAAGRNPLR